MATCASCGKSNAEHARFCQSCGAALSIDEPAHTPPVAPRHRDVRTDGLEYGGFWIRFVAFIIDAVIIGVGTGIIATASMGFMGAGIGLGIIAPWLYEALMLASEKQATIGKMAMGLVVTDYGNHRLTFGRATGRHFAKYLSGLILCIGFIMAAFTDRKQALHDMTASTLVVGTSQ